MSGWVKIPDDVKAITDIERLQQMYVLAEADAKFEREQAHKYNERLTKIEKIVDRWRLLTPEQMFRRIMDVIRDYE